MTKWKELIRRYITENCKVLIIYLNTPRFVHSPENSFIGVKHLFSVSFELNLFLTILFSLFSKSYRRIPPKATLRLLFKYSIHVPDFIPNILSRWNGTKREKTPFNLICRGTPTIFIRIFKIVLLRLKPSI